MNGFGHAFDDGSPARRIINLLLRRGQMTIAQLVETTGVTTTAIRQQVDRLLSEGWLERQPRRGGPGRPAHVLSVSEQTKRLFGGQADDLVGMIVEETVAQAGAETARDILKGVGRRMARMSHDQIGSGPMVERLKNLATVMERRGMLVEAAQTESGMSLTIFTCPYPELAGQHREICDMEREAVSELMGGPVELHQCMQDGDHCCEFSMTANEAAAG
ncbi:MAG: MarR family transcriptional regulator [Planctomycetes bacterium]|nr:MarR family transcriptional regulator [Planctomycetota bacterium]